MTRAVQSPAFVRLLLLILLLLGFLAAMTKAGECNVKCATRNCNSDGACICNLPSNSSILRGDRHFLGGEFCDTPQIICDGTNGFWCENGLCNEVIRGENYICICREGYSGKHCELKGVQCGSIFCYNNGQCNEVGVSCDCPDDWKGSLDCSSPRAESFQDTAAVELIRPDEEDHDSLYAPVVVAILVLVVGIGVIGVFCGLKSIRKQPIVASEFHKIQQLQLRGFIEKDEDAFARAPLSKAELA